LNSFWRVGIHRAGPVFLVAISLAT
jgi:hypothetical protein